MGRILVVDDEIEVCNALKEFIGSKGYEVHTALDGDNAIRKLKAVRPHVVLLDIRMPGMGGIEILKEIKRVHPETGVIMVTAVADQETAVKAVELGAYDYITKPVDLNYLNTVVMVKLVDLLG